VRKYKIFLRDETAGQNQTGSQAQVNVFAHGHLRAQPAENRFVPVCTQVLEASTIKHFRIQGPSTKYTMYSMNKTPSSTRSKSTLTRGHIQRRASSSFSRSASHYSSDYVSFQIELQKPLGLILGTTREGGGAIVEDIIVKGNADLDGTVEIGDIISTLTTDTGVQSCITMSFDDILKLLAHTSDKVQIGFRREVQTDLDAAKNVAAYWERKRKDREHGRRTLRRTVGVHPEDIIIGTPISQGNFGSVFSGYWKDAAIILKTSKSNVLWADDLLDVELEMNEIVHKRAKGSCARFLGCCEIDSRSEGQIYNGELSAGLWLMWKNDGCQTLGELYSHDQAHVMGVLRERMGKDDAEPATVIIKTLIYQLASCLSLLHIKGVVHRDLKPENILLSDCGVVLIDLGASASCLDQIINYYRGPGPADPLYSAPSESFLLPMNAPDPEPHNLTLLWEKFKPDRFDIFSLGVIFLQLCIVPLRSKANLERFIQELSACSLDLIKWKTDICRFSSQDTNFLDADNGAGWDFAKDLLNERTIRISASQVISHEFLFRRE